MLNFESGMLDSSPYDIIAFEKNTVSDFQYFSRELELIKAAREKASAEELKNIKKPFSGNLPTNGFPSNGGFGGIR